MFCGNDKVTLPVPAEAVTWLEVPVMEVTPLLLIVVPLIPIPVPAVKVIAPVPPWNEVTPALVKVIEPPSETEPPPLNPEPAVTVTEELVRSALATEPLTIEVELTDAVVINPFTSTANRSVSAAAF